jgi:hypothetical protein
MERVRGCDVEQRSAAARRDGLCCLLGMAALYYGFGGVHDHGSASPAVGALLFFSPLIGGMVLGLRGHVPPRHMHVYLGAVNAIATLLPILLFRSGAELTWLAWGSIAQVFSLLGLIAFPAALCSFGGAELGGLVHRSLARQ